MLYEVPWYTVVCSACRSKTGALSHSSAASDVYKRQALRNVGHSALSSPCRYVAAIVLYEKRDPVRGLNRWEYEWLALSPKFNAKPHRWRENSYVFQVDQ